MLMSARLEWRTRGKGKDALIYVREYGEAGDTVMKKWEADPGRLTDFLNQMSDLDTDGARLETSVDERDPGKFGKLVLSREPGGAILDIDPEAYWDQIYYWFRSRGNDPHLWRGGH